jgi:D-glutamate cyclase
VADKIEAIAENMELLSTVELSRYAYGRGVIPRLYHASRSKQGGIPSLTAARTLCERTKPGNVVVIITGAGGGDSLPFGENDGPMGAAAIAGALKFGLGAVPIILTEQAFLEMTRATTRAFGMWPSDLAAARRAHHHVAVDSFPADEAAETTADALLNLGPSAVIAIEKLGLNAKGVAHSATGKPLGEGRARAEVLTAKARQAGVYTLGIADNGNEIGCGIIADAVREYKPYGAVCQCPCQSGLACVDETDNLLIANVSNWGGYVLAATLGLLLGKPDLIHDGPLEERALWICAQAGGGDGRSGRPIFAADGIPGKYHGYFVDTLRYMVEFAQTEPPERPF